jgi:bifunctional DNA-binding transcriptional regulator/antitoxin component of YhaV-PrlF toxin-antitoxin module
MNKVATFKVKYLKDGHLSIPKEVVASLLLKRGEEVRVVIEKKKFDKKGFLSLFGIWRDKSEEEIHLYREIVKEREMFGRGEVEL